MLRYITILQAVNTV